VLARRGAVLVMPALLVLGVASCRSARDEALPGTLPPIGGVSTTDPSGSDSTAATTTVTTEAPTTTTTEPMVFTGTSVVVANASNVNGAAGRLSDELAAAGFEMGTPTNGWGPEEELEVTRLYYVPGTGEDVARSVGRLIGIEPTPIPVPAWVTGGTETLGGAGVLIMLGKDLASTFLADMQPGA
jgi:hypothetical protein